MVCDSLLTTVGLVQGIFLFLSVVVGLITVIIAVAYMAGSALKQESYTNFAKRELYNLAISLLLLALFMPFISTLNILSCVNDVSIFDSNINRMDGVLYGELYPVLNNLYKMSIMHQSASAFKLSFGAGTMKPLGFLKEVSKSLNLIVFIVEIAFMSIYIQSLALAFLKVTAFNVFFPMGILFRAMPYLRSYGNLIIALSISLSTIYPYMYYESMNSYYNVLDAINFKDKVHAFINPVYLLEGITEIDNSLFYFLSFLSYDGIRDIFFTFGRILFLAVGVPALVLILTVACTSAVNKFLKEIGV